MTSKQKGRKPQDCSLTPREASYRESLIHVTRLGGITAGVFLVCFVLLYWTLDFPLVIVLINLTALLVDLTGLALVSYFQVHKPAAHLIAFATYFCLFGTALYTGGIDSSSMAWMAFVPFAATIMAGTKEGILWGAVSVTSILGVYFLNQSLGIDLTLMAPKSIDRMIDLMAITLVIGIAVTLNERVKARALNHLESAQAVLNHLAMVDPLTNVFNRRYFFDRAQIELEIARLRKSRTSMILLDIDHFKRINDSYGHNVGDQILIGMVAICHESLRETDTLARLGGEEFVILLPETDLPEARHIAERLRARLEHTPIKTEAGSLKVTVSLGVSSPPTSDVVVPVHKLVQGADKAMYLAKRAGRNRVATWQGQEQKSNSGN